MREIKFRCFWKKTNVIDYNIESTYDWEFMPLSTGEDNECVLMQYTGLKDKNGSGNICLFEGDILSLSGELIGNIYENQNLLKDTTNFVIKQLGTKDWRSSEKEAMDRGWGYPI